MSATVETTTSQGRIVQVLGAIVDVEFPADALPEINNALTTNVELAGQGESESDFQMTLEVSQHLGDNVVRCVAMSSTDGLTRGMEAVDTGSPITVPATGARTVWRSARSAEGRNFSSTSRRRSAVSFSSSAACC